MENDRHENHDAPPGLIHALRNLRVRDVSIPQSVDDAIVAAARRRLGKPSRRGLPGLGWWDSFRAWPAWARVPALAACALVVCLAAFLVQRNLPSGYAREDLNRDGLIDIRDAFQLARELESGRAQAPALDFNGDGAVDRADADAIAAEAVSLARKGGRS